MWSWARRTRAAALTAALLAVLCAAGCAGYQFGGQAPVVLPQGMRTLAIAEVGNPTLLAGLEADLRAAVRDEFNRRGQIGWAAPDQADALLKLTVKRFTDQSKVRDEEDRTLKFVVELRMQAELVAREDGVVIWESGPIYTWQSYQARGGLSRARHIAIDLAVRELADRMGHAY